MNPHQISEYIENLPLQKAFCKGYRPDEVYEVICTLSSMYNQVLSEAYEENEELKRKVEFITSRTQNGDDKEKFVKPYVEELMMQSNREICSMQKINDNSIQIEEKTQDMIADKELQKLKRGELLEIMLEQSRENEALKMQLEESSRSIEDLRHQLENRKIVLKEAGNIAEASLKLNGVFDAAQKAAQQYLENLEDLYRTESADLMKREAEIETRCAAMLQATQERCDFMKEEAERECRELENAVRNRCEELEMSAKTKSEEMLRSAQKQHDSILADIENACATREKAAEEKCAELDKKAKEDVDKRWEELSKRLEAFYTAHEGLKDIMLATRVI